MPRNRQSAKKAGTTFERQVADYLKSTLDNPHIDRRVKTGNKDRGDISGVYAHGKPIAIECKNTTRPELSQWIKEAHLEAGNADAYIGLIVHKRRGTQNAARQWVTMTLEDLTALITGDDMPGRYEP
ncbi:putative PDDEXK endonuclease [Corynebacterium heidelbergense]|uniref:Holliday junction resolvase n=1 Tax=Corynebacterium heidelbergense TaxID=2055947 RepID=A0A364V986_9CORY|nr:hypothetical protein [Corynebacterium heidelbergense]RAV33205.1 hypothetical protein CWC39_09670 [Corynebacterium heidelbergense]WCZ36996.1 hypothetical protein CHEID_07315 [Corynebacterium heidelbergense]